jgi:hypothetical protein
MGDWLTIAVLVILVAILRWDAPAGSRPARAEGIEFHDVAQAFETANRIRGEALHVWTEEDLRADVRRLRRWCWTWAALLVLGGVPLLIFDLLTGGLGHAT